jgi:hypothetical protein
MIRKNERDTIIDEIHQTRRAIADKFDRDIAAILDDARKRQAASGRAVWHGKSSNQTPDRSGRSGGNGFTA